MMLLFRYLLKLCLASSSIWSTVSEVVKLTATHTSKLPNRLHFVSAIYDGGDSIYIFGGENALNATGKNDIVKYNILTSNVSIVGKIETYTEDGILQIDSLGNILYFAWGKLNVFNPTTNRIDVISLDSLGLPLLSSKYNESQVIIVNACDTIGNFDLKTLQFSEFGNLPGKCPSTSINAFCGWKNRIAILSRSGKSFHLDLDALQTEKIPETLFENFDSETRGVCYDQYIYTIGTYNNSQSSEITVYTMSEFNMETNELTYFEIDNLPFWKETSFYPAVGVFVRKLNRLYFLSEYYHSGDNAASVEVDVRPEIWFIQLPSLGTNQSNELNLINGEKFESLGLGWILGISIIALGLIGVSLIIVIAKANKYSVVRIDITTTDIVVKELSNEPENVRLIIWKSEQSCQPTPPYEIGTGSFAKVYKAEDSLQPGVFYAVKQIALYKALVYMETWEVNNLQEIENENVVKLYGFWVEDHFGKEMSKEGQVENLQFHEWSSTQNHFLYLKMEFCDYTLQDWLTTRPILENREVKEIKRMMFQIVNGLRGIHAKGIIHRDIKPNNIFFCENQDLWKIGDLGLSTKGQDAPSDLTIIGCESYKSPEMASGEYDSKTDVFSLGLTFLEIIHIFPDEFARIRKFNKIREGETPTEGNSSKLFPEIIELSFKMLVVDPNSRISIYDTLFEDLLTNTT